MVFASDDYVLIGAVIRPPAWPSFRFHSDRIMSSLSLIPFWRVVLEHSSTNRGAYLIARSITREDRRQLYVAAGFHFWLQNLFVSEERFV